MEFTANRGSPVMFSNESPDEPRLFLWKLTWCYDRFIINNLSIRWIKIHFQINIHVIEIISVLSKIPARESFRVQNWNHGTLRLQHLIGYGHEFHQTVWLGHRFGHRLTQFPIKQNPRDDFNYFWLNCKEIKFLGRIKISRNKKILSHFGVW